MIGKNRLAQRLYLATYDKAGLNRKALRIRKSLEEVKRILGGKDKS